MCGAITVNIYTLDLKKVMHRAQVDTDKGVQGRVWDEKPGGRWASTLKRASGRVGGGGGSGA